MAELRIRVKFSSASARRALAAGLLLSCAAELATENSSLSTYYPAPSGVYSSIVATRSALLARDPGSGVGVGTTHPQAALDVNGVFLAAGKPVLAGVAQPCPSQYTCRQTGNLLTITKTCGATGQPCCSGSSCDNGLTCMSGYCQSGCGGSGQPCCPPPKILIAGLLPPPSPGCGSASLKCVGGSCNLFGCNGGTCLPPCGTVAWTNQGCGAGGCPATSMYRVPSCTSAACSDCPAAQCAANDPSCAPACAGVAWADAGCGQGGCPATSMYQTGTCTPSGCQGSCGATTRCVAGSPSCAPPPPPGCGTSCTPSGNFVSCSYYATWLPPCNWCAYYTQWPSGPHLQTIVPCDGCRKACYGY